MFERSVGDSDDQLIGRLAIGFNNDGAVLALGRVQQWPDSVERNFLVAKINRRHRAAGDADDLLILLRAEKEWRGRGRNCDSRLENKIGAEEQKENEEKHNVDQREDDEPAEVVFSCPAQFHPGRCRSNDRDELLVNLAAPRRIAEN